MEFWRAGYGVTRVSPGEAAAIEAAGWDGQMAMDSQSLAADPYVVLAALACQSDRLLLGTSVSNACTRHPAVTACAMASLQVLSGGRAVLGIGRGDSSLAYLGTGPQPLAAFERSLYALQDYLSGREVTLGADDAWTDVAASARQAPGRMPAAAGLRWLPADLPKVPLDVAATGPKTIAVAARVAERITLSVGAMPERLRWAMEVARAARVDADLDPDGVAVGAQLVVVPHPEISVARDLARDLVAPLARFSTMAGTTVGPSTEDDERVFAGLREHYDMNRHGRAPAGVVTDAFIDRFAVVGRPEDCVRRLEELAAIGLRHMIVCRAVGTQDPALARESDRLFEQEVLPALRP